MDLSLLIDCLVAVLLVVTIVYCALLDRRLRALRSGQDGLRAVITELDAATAKAERAISSLARLGETEGSALGGTLAKARSLADELSLMIESGNSLATRLEGVRSRTAPGPQGTSGQAAPLAAENPLLKALREAR
ncbi:MAG: hypothetical protein HXY25_07680 [Alphaproteobacteria bacterium]|nr:hypothetical protein [Alphaproteobacteria bacterium]